jgi:hypothetical protein
MQLEGIGKSGGTEIKWDTSATVLCFFFFFFFLYGAAAHIGHWPPLL